MKLQKIDHTLIFVSDLTGSKDYFEELLGACVRYRDSSHETLIVEVDTVRFFVESHEAAGRVPQHLSFAVEELASIEKQLEEKGITFSRGSVDFLSLNNYEWLEWLGPDKIRLECVQYKDQT